MQFTNCTTRKLLFHDPYKSYGWTVAIYDSYQVVYIGHGCTIPTKLFWFVCDKALPIKSEFCLIFRNIVLILAFLFFVVYSIVSFGNQYVSAVFSTIAVVVTGIIPALVLKGLTKDNMFIGWEKIKIKREIETAVKEFYQGRNSTNSRDLEEIQLRSINNDDDDTLV